jgi:pimeloyl-ACP methyl ester carboxylesterase
MKALRVTILFIFIALVISILVVIGCRKIRQNQLFLADQSWGTLISILAVKKEPDLFDKYIGIGQIVSLRECDLVSFDYTMNKAKELDDKKSLDILPNLNRKDYNKNYKLLSKQRRVLTKLGGRFYDNSFKSTLIKTALIAPEYSVRDLYYIYRSAKILNCHLYNDMLKYNLYSKANSLPVPVCFISERYDYHTPIKTIKEYYNQLKNNDKELFIFEESGHIPNYEEPELFYETLIKLK